MWVFEVAFGIWVVGVGSRGSLCVFLELLAVRVEDGLDEPWPARCGDVAELEGVVGERPTDAVERGEEVGVERFEGRVVRACVGDARA